MYFEIKNKTIKNKTSSTLVQLTVHFLNEKKRTATKREKKRRTIRTVGVNSTGYLLQLCKIYLF